MNTALTVVVPTHNPNRIRLARTLAALETQTLPVTDWDTLIVDNASEPPLDPAALPLARPMQIRIAREPQLGLTAARLRGIRETRGEMIVFVDDDNVLASDYLENVLSIFAAHSHIGLAGGKSLPEFEVNPPDWSREFFPLLALRDLGDKPLISGGLRPNATPHNEYPAFAPIGAGMAARRAALQPWLGRRTALPDRRGHDLSSGGDNDIVLCALRDGWEVGYFPQLKLTHLIPGDRLAPRYLARLNRGIQRSWQQVLAHHEASAWTPLTRTGAALRKAKAWFTYRGWSVPAGRIHWHGACGHFDGRVVPRP